MPHGATRLYFLSQKHRPVAPSPFPSSIASPKMKSHRLATAFTMHWFRYKIDRPMSDLVLQPAVDLLAMISAGKLSSLELAEEHILQIKRLNPQLHALIDFDEQRVRAQAIALDQAAHRGPLHGLPMTIKASIAVAGHRCETGSL